jgi:hypothetical protein
MSKDLTVGLGECIQEKTGTGGPRG